MNSYKVLKVCINPHCEEVAHNCPKGETRCRNCNGRLCEINKKTYGDKFINNYFQYNYDDYEAGVVTPMQMGYVLQATLF